MIGIGSEVGLEEDTSSERGEIPWSILSSDVGSAVYPHFDVISF